MSKPVKLLLVDDEPGVRESVQAYLEYSGDFQVQVASSANDAWEILQQDTPDLVISDIMMPQVDGYQFLQKLRNDPRFQTIPVVFLTARGMRRQEAGISDLTGKVRASWPDFCK